MSTEKTEKVVAAVIVGGFLALPLYGAVQWGVRGFFLGLGAIALWLIIYFGFFGGLEWWVRRMDPNRHLNDYGEVKRREFEELKRRERG
jgi:hypothetical protein